MAVVTTTEIEKIISGEPVKLSLPFPDKTKPEAEWYMKQPTDWQYDMANAVTEAFQAELLAQPEMQAAKSLPPSDDWIARQTRAMEADKARIAVLEAKGAALQPEEDLELQNTRYHLDNLYTVDNYNRALEICASKIYSARSGWLAQRLIVDAKGKLLFDPATKEGQAAWHKLGKKVRTELMIELASIESMIVTAKNSEADKSSQ